MSLGESLWQNTVDARKEERMIKQQFIVDKLTPHIESKAYHFGEISRQNKRSGFLYYEKDSNTCELMKKIIDDITVKGLHFTVSQSTSIWKSGCDVRAHWGRGDYDDKYK